MACVSSSSCWLPASPILRQRKMASKKRGARLLASLSQKNRKWFSFSAAPILGPKSLSVLLKLFTKSDWSPTCRITQGFWQLFLERCSTNDRCT